MAKYDAAAVAVLKALFETAAQDIQGLHIGVRTPNGLHT